MKIFIAGDSTASIKLATKRPETGWGEKLHLFLDDSIEICNYAENGRSTKSFLELGILDKMENEFSKGDILLIQFGHNDGKKDDKTRYTNYQDYIKNLDIFVSRAKKHNVTPIILTSASRRMFLEDKVTIDSTAVDQYPMYAKMFADKRTIVLLDIFKESKELYEKLGYELSKKLFLQLPPNAHIHYMEGIIDNTHFNYAGAIIIASLIAKALLEKDTQLNNHIIKDEIMSFEEIVKFLNNYMEL